MAASNSYVALLRGINVGGNNKLPMKDLASLFAKAGCSDVQTYIQSGNVVFGARAKAAEGIASVITNDIEKRFGFSVPVIVRSAQQISTAIEANPFLKENLNEDFLHVVFLKDAPVGTLDKDRSPADRFVVQGSEIHLYLPKGVAGTKLTNAYFDSQLKTVSTQRNWRTVLKLRELLNGRNRSRS